jgi:hypothetical protein
MTTTELITHTETSIEAAAAEQSKLSPEVLALPGMSSAKGRHLLNQLASRPGLRYLEVGLWQGSTFCAALAGNAPEIAVGVDNWSLFGGPRTAFEINANRFLDGLPWQLIDGDFFRLDLTHHAPFNLYFYDGDHEEEAQRQAILHGSRWLDRPSLIIVDDWQFAGVEAGTRAGLAAAQLTLGHEWTLSNEGINNAAAWWNGLWLGVVE